jgi:hypothetical protein
MISLTVECQAVTRPQVSPMVTLEHRAFLSHAVYLCVSNDSHSKIRMLLKYISSKSAINPCFKTLNSYNFL